MLSRLPALWALVLRPLVPLAPAARSLQALRLRLLLFLLRLFRRAFLLGLLASRLRFPLVSRHLAHSLLFLSLSLVSWILLACKRFQPGLQPAQALQLGRLADCKFVLHHV